MIHTPIISGSKLSSADSRAHAQGQATATSEAARQFEGILLQQLIRVLRSTAPSMGGSAEDSYVEMFDGQLADQLAEAGGIGLAQQIELGLSPELSGALTSHRSSFTQIKGAHVAPAGAVSATTGTALTGPTLALQQAAHQILSAGSAQWSKNGAVSEDDLRSKFATSDANGDQATFVVRQALGYQGYNKCNLFALELARRAGFQVPLINRPGGWGFPSSNGVTTDAVRDGKLSSEWANVVGFESASELDSSILRGERAFMLAGSGRDGAQGHMAVVERIREIKYDENHTITGIAFDGWEARPMDGAEHLVQRYWTTGGAGGRPLTRSGFDQIRLIALKPASVGSTAEHPITGRMVSNIFSSNSGEDRPNERMEIIP
jgi:Rod binding domain-containing protein